MNLYHIDQAYLLYIDPDTGEVTDEEAFTRLMYERENAIEELALLYKDYMAEAKAIKDEAKTLSARAALKEKKAETIKRRLQEHLQGISIETPRASISFRRSEAVDIVDEEKIPIDYMRIKQEPDKSKIKADLKCGKNIPGTELVSRENMTIK